jgi:hypothetical protein
LATLRRGITLSRLWMYTKFGIDWFKLEQ